MFFSETRSRMCRIGFAGRICTMRMSSIKELHNNLFLNAKAARSAALQGANAQRFRNLKVLEALFNFV